MPKTMTFDRKELEIVRRLLRKELKAAQRRVDSAKARGPEWKYVYEKRWDELNCIAGLLQEAQLPVMVTRRNLMTGQEYREAEDTPPHCSPASESYWSM
jgi:hypothetical protein